MTFKIKKVSQINKDQECGRKNVSGAKYYTNNWIDLWGILERNSIKLDSGD